MIELKKEETADFVEKSDMGLNFIDASALQQHADTKLAEQNKLLRAQLAQVHKDFNEYNDLVTTFLFKLGQRPSVKHLHWPERTEVIADLQSKLSKLVQHHWYR